LLAGRPGDRPGSSTGSSVEFQDYRSYAPGDDPRTIDWKAYARTETLTVRLFREEVAPRVDFVVDDSASMAMSEAKQRRLLELVLFFSLLALRDHAHLALISERGPERITDPWKLRFTFKRKHPPFSPGGLRGFGPRSVRVVISDFLFPHDPHALLGYLARGAGRLFLIRLNGSEELDPPFRGALRLVDAEDGSVLQTVVSQQVVGRYRARLHGLFEEIEKEARRAKALLCALRAEDSLEESVTGLLRAGMVETV